MLQMTFTTIEENGLFIAGAILVDQGRRYVRRVVFPAAASRSKAASSARGISRRAESVSERWRPTTSWTRTWSAVRHRHVSPCLSASITWSDTTSTTTGTWPVARMSNGSIRSPWRGNTTRMQALTASRPFSTCWTGQTPGNGSARRTRP